MSSLYVCLFSNGHLKVGRSVNALPTERCPEIEAATGVRCEELRPDVNWAVLRMPPKEHAHAA